MFYKDYLKKKKQRNAKKNNNLLMNITIKFCKSSYIENIIFGLKKEKKKECFFLGVKHDYS